METYARLSRAQLSFDYLHTNSTTHEFLFGAIAELIDNARDAGATEIDIFTVKNQTLRGGFLLYFLDNGCGMSAGKFGYSDLLCIDEAKNVIVFGKSFKRSDDRSSIGMYGNGLKSGSMRIGNDMILFTKRDGVFSCVFLSRTFHEAEKLDEVIVPLPTFRVNDRSPYISSSDEQKKHEVEMQIIYKFSPFQCARDFFYQFDRIKGDSGTLVIVYNMKLLDNGSTELDITTDSRDILLAASSDREDPMEPHAEIELPPEKRSLRAYVSILYADPRMKVYIQSRKVQTKRLLDTLYAVKRYNFASKTFRTRAERELAKAKEDVKVAELLAIEAESKARDCELRYENSKDHEHLKLIRRLNNVAAEKRNLVTIKQNVVARKQKALKDPKTLTFYFGMNVVNRACDGMFVYNCSRLIKMYQRIGPQQDSSMTCRGVVGIVDVPYMVLEPTHNKQDFADAKEFRQLMRAMADHLMQYWDDLAIEKNGSEDTNRFWKSFGYLSARWRDPPSDDEKYARKRYSCVSLCVQCDKCLKWRVLPYSQSQVGRDVPDNWQCRDNPDQKHRSCDTPEEDMSPLLGVLKRKIKTKEQRQAELEAQIRKKQEELELILDPDEEPSVRGRGKRPSRSFPNSTLPAKKRTTRCASPPARTITVADKKRMTTLPEVQSTPRSATRKACISVPKPKPTFCSTNVPRQVSSRRSLRRQSAESDEGGEGEEDVALEEEDEVSYEKMGVKTVVGSNAGIKTDSESSSTTETNENAARESLNSRNAFENTPKENAEETSESVTKSSSLFSNGSPKESSSEAAKKHHEDAVRDTGPTLSPKDGHDTAATTKIAEKLKICLRYFLPPKWPMEKERIHTLTVVDLAEFPLESFFDRYEQGLRALLGNFQQETQLIGETLQNLRVDVARLLDKIAPDLNASSRAKETIDQVLRDYLDQNP
uniref:MORC family CW type zinc finger protein 2B n=1 Tax=Echinococcus granulosus TaxID=6210 RepID=A0A068WBS6_ECHGR|nr:MORC family CW type zinc finger protein 2B [Echinococcus granulosus]